MGHGRDEFREFRSEILTIAHAREVGGRGHRDDGLHAARGAGVAAVAFERSHRSTRAQHGDEVPSGRAADGTNAVGIETMLGGIRSDPAHGGFAVHHRRREFHFGQQAVADARRREALLGERARDVREARFVTTAPTAAVDDNDARDFSRRGLLREVKIELHLAAAVARVNDVALDLDRGRQRAARGLALRIGCGLAFFLRGLGGGGQREREGQKRECEGAE